MGSEKGLRRGTPGDVTVVCQVGGGGKQAMTQTNPGEAPVCSGLLQPASCLGAAVPALGFLVSLHKPGQVLKPVCSITVFQLCFLSPWFLSISENKLSSTHTPIWIGLIDWKYFLMVSILLDLQLI